METRSRKKQRVCSQPGSILCEWGSSGEQNGKFNFAYGAALAVSHKDKRIYVCDSGNSRIQCFESTGVFVRKWGRYGEDDGQFRCPTGVAIGVGHGANESILQALRTVAELRVFPPGLLPICVAYVGEEFVVTIEGEGCRAQVFALDGTFVRKWGRKGDNDGEFRWPGTCSVDDNGNIYVGSNTPSPTLQAFREDGTFIRKWQLKNTVICALSVSGRGNIYIADRVDRCLMHFRLDEASELVAGSSHGCVADAFSSRTISIAGLLNSVLCMTVDVENEIIYVCDPTNANIGLFHSGSLTFIKKWSRHANCPIESPWAVAKLSDGTLYIIDGRRSSIIAMMAPVCGLFKVK